MIISNSTDASDSYECLDYETQTKRLAMKGAFVVIRKNILLLSACIVILAVSVLNGYGQQSAAATLRGRVVDPNGAVVSGAQVIAKHKATGVRRTTTTNDEGLFVISKLAAGDYEVRAQAKGFADKVLSVITLQVGQTFTLGLTLTVTMTEKVVIDDR